MEVVEEATLEAAVAGGAAVAAEAVEAVEVAEVATAAPTLGGEAIMAAAGRIAVVEAAMMVAAAMVGPAHRELGWVEIATEVEIKTEIEIATGIAIGIGKPRMRLGRATAPQAVGSAQQSLVRRTMPGTLQRLQAARLDQP